MLTEEQKRLLIEKIKKGEPLPGAFKPLLFSPEDAQYVEVTGVYQLNYKGKAREQDILADTPAAPLQEVRTFNADNPHEPGKPDSWRNLLIYGDNLLAMKALYEDQRGPNQLGTRDRIKLVYIDPPFATKQDFMKDREKAYRDKLIGARFIEFLRRRLILIRELLADDGFLFVHLDHKKVHYIKALLDEIFDETCFKNEIILPRPFTKNLQQQFKELSSLNVRHDTLLFYSKRPETTFPRLWVDKEVVVHPEGHWHHLWSNADRPTMRYELFGIKPSSGQWVWGEKRGRQAVKNYEIFLKEGNGRTLVEYWRDTGETLRFIRRSDDGKPQYWRAPASQKLADTIWNVLTYENHKIYPTQKHEDLLNLVLRGFSTENDIVLDAFAGSGTTLAVAEKTQRRWIGMDCGRLALYTMQRRLLNMNSQIGSGKKDERREHERVEDFDAHSKSDTKAALLLYDKVKAGELDITDALLTDLAFLIEKHIAPLKSKDRKKKSGDLAKFEFSLMCPQDKFMIRSLTVEEPGEDDRAGDQLVVVGNVLFRVSFIQSRTTTEKGEPLRAKEFVLLNAGIYDRQKIRDLPWAAYRPFVMQLFGVREDRQRLHTLEIDGFIGPDPAVVWNYPDQKHMELDEGYVESLHTAMRGQAGDKFYIIAPVPALRFMTDELRYGNTRYIVLKVPESILNRLLESGEPGALRQPMSEQDVNAVIDAVGFDFISQPQTEQQFLLEVPEKEDLLNKGMHEAVIRLTEFRAKTFVTDPNDFPNFATLSMVLVDTDYKREIFNLGRVLWAEDIVNSELIRLEKLTAGEFGEKAKQCERLDIRLPLDGIGDQVMVILVDQYGNEKRLAISRKEFAAAGKKAGAPNLATVVKGKVSGRAASRTFTPCMSARGLLSSTASRRRALVLWC